MNQKSYQLVLSTCPDEETATEIAQTLVNEGLAACVNILPITHSIYRWKGKTEFAAELLLIIKSKKNTYDAIEKRIRELHTYELPEVIAVPIIGGSAQYLSWLDNPDAS